MNLLDETRNMEQEHTAVNRGGVGSSQLGELKKSPYTSAFTGFCYTQDRREGFEKAMYC